MMRKSKKDRRYGQKQLILFLTFLLGAIPKLSFANIPTSTGAEKEKDSTAYIYVFDASAIHISGSATVVGKIIYQTHKPAKTNSKKKVESKKKIAKKNLFTTKKQAIVGRKAPIAETYNDPDKDLSNISHNWTSNIKIAIANNIYKTVALIPKESYNSSISNYIATRLHIYFSGFTLLTDFLTSNFTRPPPIFCDLYKQNIIKTMT